MYKRQEHALHLREVLETLREHNLKAKFSRCHFCRKEVLLLWHVVSKEGIAVDPAKVVAIQDWKVPKNAT